MFPWNQFPFNNNDFKNLLQNLKPDEMNKYIQGMIETTIPSNMKGMMNPFDLMNHSQTRQEQRASVAPLNSTSFETHDYVYVRIPLKNDDWVKKVHIYHTSNQLIVEQIPHAEDKHTITLPAIVKKKGAVAHYKDGMLEVRIPKNVDLQFSQIDVTEI